MHIPHNNVINIFHLFDCFLPVVKEINRRKRELICLVKIKKKMYNNI